MAGSMRLSLIINADGTAAIQGINRVRGELGELDQAANRAASGGLAGLANQLKGLAMTAAAALGVSNLAQSFTAANVAAGTLRAGLETVTGSAKAGAVAWAQLQAFAAQTPFSLQQATEGFIKLKAMGLDPSREALLSYANTASAMGKDLSMMIEAVVDASNSSFERLREFGITASQEGDKVSLTFQGVTTTIGNNAAEIEAYLRRIGEVQFAGAIERQSENLGVALSNVGDAWDQLMVEVGDAGLTAVLVEGLQEVTGWISALKGEIADGLGADVSVTLTETISLFEGWSAAVSGIPPLVRDLGAALAELPNYTLIIRDGTLAIEEQGTAWEAVAALVAFAGEAFLDLPDNLRAAVFIILGEIDVLTVNFQSGMEQLPIIAAQAWAAIQNAIASAIGTIKIAVAEMVAYVAGQLASLATDMAGVMAQIPEALDIGGMASAAAASLTDLASSLKSTEDNVADLKAEQAALGDQYEQDAQALKGQQEAITARAETEIAAIRGVIQAGIEEAKAKKTARKAQADLNAEFAKAVADQAALERQSLKTGAAITGGGKAASGAAKSTKDLANAKGGAAKASKELEAAQRAETQAMAAATRTVDGLVQKYLPAKAAAQDYQESMAALAKAGEAVGLSQAELSVIAEGLAKDQAKAADAARREADAFYAAWADVVDSLDGTFKGLWRGLITGQGDVLGNLKETVLEWVADLSYQLLLSPLVVPIQTALLGGTGAAVTGSASGMVSGAGSLGGVGNLFSSLSSGMSWFSTALSSVTSGAIFSGISTGFGLATANIGAAGYFGAMGTTLATAGSSFASGAIGTGIGMAAPYLLPAIAAIAAIAALSGAFTGDGYDHEPGYWGVSTGGSGVDNRFRGGRGVSGGFGLSFGVDAASTDEFDWDMWPEYEKMMAAMADMSQQLANFYGEDVAKAVEKALSDASGEGLLLLTHEFSSSFVYAFDRIIAEAAKTGDDLAVVMEDVFSGIVDYTSMDTYATSIQEAMVIAQTALAMADDLAGTAMGDALKLTGDVVADAKRLADYGLLVREEGEGAAEAFVRMATQLAVLDQAVQQTATDLSGLTAEGVLELSTALVDAFGSLDAATQAQAFYYDQFTTQTEKLVDAIQAAADQIDREIPKLQDELMKLSEDVIQEVKKIADDLDAGLEDLSGALEDTGNFWVDTQRRLADEWAKGIAENAAAIADGSASAATQAVTTWQLWQIVEEGLGNYGDALRDLGYDVDNGAEAFIESLNRVRDAVKDPLSPEGDGATPDTITIPGDPNAAILAKLLDDLPKTREGFNELIGGLKLTDEASRKLYAGLMELLPQFDLLYDGAEAFTDWLLGVDEAEQATRALEAVFKDWGLTLPENREALERLYASGTLTTEQMAILGAHLKELGIMFGEVDKAVISTTALEQDLAKRKADLEIDLLRITEGEAAALAEARRRELAAMEESLRPRQEEIYAIEDEIAALEKLSKQQEDLARRRAEAEQAQADAEMALIAARFGPQAALEEARRREFAAADESLRPILERIWAIEDETRALQQQAKAAEEAKALNIRLAEASGDSELATKLRREQELAAATSDANREILKQIYALEDAAAAYGALVSAAQAEREAINAQYQARIDAIAVERAALDAQHQARLAAIANEREAVNAAYQARMDGIAAEREAAQQANQAQLEALAKQRETAQEALAVAEAGLSRIQSALDAFRGDAPRNEMERMRALRQLDAWARAGTLPGEEQLDRAITGATNLNAEDFGTEAAYRAAQGSAYSALLALEKVGVRQVSDAERQIAAIETASDRAAAAYEAQLAAIDAQAEQAAGQRDAALEILARQEESATAWRDQELARLEAETEAAQTWRDENLAAIDDLLELAAKQVAILEGTYVETKTLAEAINDLNDALIDAGGEPLAPTQADLAALLPPMGDIAAATNATTTEVIALRQEIVVLRQDLAAVATAQVVPLKAIDERLRKWDLDGMPSSAEATGTETALRAA